ncbi:MAG: MipA/OmpV family protein [Thiogranum sp.]|nr:MipA/OmpV family protein [Thiogranum sp.]
MQKMLAVFAITLTSTAALAGGLGDLATLPDSKPGVDGDFTGMIGLGALVRPEYIGSDNNETKAVPLINLNYRDIAYIKFNRAGLWFWKPEETGLRFGALVKPRTGWRSNDGSRLSGMDTRGDSLEAGLNVAWRFDRAAVEAAYLTDMSDESDGDSAFVNVSYSFVDSSQWQVRGQIGFEYLDDDVTGYYWGVPAAEATATRPVYSPDEAWNTSVGLIATYHLTDSWALMGGAVHTMLGDEIADSPILEEDSATTAFAGAVWKF